ncbi:Protein of unknown function [Lentzea waywayandensis]|uniref:SMODS and SLOG-associating 2TM effector domain-containing protein n=1 Tax=Lentzea waywayandensis TaxID=84724 RepID=A0A1I6DN27_9PSEU|nr:DUF4231 domain-containing protein [Lentzea waywayandensis]SFR06796.1 Protein of unknown function [Lentzea waywayandensis]
MKSIPAFPDRIAKMSDGVIATADAYGTWLRSFYDVRARWHRLFYRLSGTLVILVGAALPVLTSLDYPGKAVTISLAGVAVAGLTGLRAFYRWDQSWILLRNSEMAVTAAYLEWKTTPGNFPAAEDVSQRVVQEKAASAFIDKLGDLRQREATVFFKDMAFPDLNGAKT